MSPNRRIALNIVATYGRSIYTMFIGLFTVRWAINALGIVDYGLYGVVGGLTAFIGFFNGLLTASIGRFYAFSIGEALTTENKIEALENCRRWFSIATLIHTFIPVVAVLIGYPLCIWFIRNILSIPVERLDDCIVVFRWSCLMCFVSMATVPISAMYVAKQRIAEITIFSIFTSTASACCLYYMATHAGNWLVKYALLMSLMSVLPNLLIFVLGLIFFEECRFRVNYCFDWERIKKVISFAFWQFWGALGVLVRTQGLAVLVNKAFGAEFNSSMNVANSVAAHAESLSNSMYGAFSPAITVRAGAGERKKMVSLSNSASKFGAIMSLLFALPLSIEVNWVLKAWLGNDLPPLLSHAAILTLVYMVEDQILKGINMAIIADGRVAKFMFQVGGFMTLSLPVAWGLVRIFGCGFISIFWVLVMFRMIVGFIIMPIAKEQVGFEPFKWVQEILMPVACASLIGVGVGVVPRMLINEESFARVAISTIVTLVAFCAATWVIVFSEDERLFVKSRYKELSKRIGLT